MPAKGTGKLIPLPPHALSIGALRVDGMHVLGFGFGCSCGERPTVIWGPNEIQPLVVDINEVAAEIMRLNATKAT